MKLGMDKSSTAESISEMEEILTFTIDLVSLCKTFNHACRDIAVTPELLDAYIQEIEAVRDDL